MTTKQNYQALDTALQKVTATQRGTLRKTITATLIPLTLGLVFLVLTFCQVSELQEEKKTLTLDTQALTTQINDLQNKDRNLKTEIETKRNELMKLQQDIALLEPLAGEALGRTPQNIQEAADEILASARAAAEASAIANDEGEFTRRKNLTIAQYSKSLDSEVNLDVVVRSLKKFGFQILIKPSLSQDVQTNALWFGADVQDNDVRLAALTLMGAGVDLKWISRFKDDVNFNSDMRSRITIGGWNLVEEYQPWTTEEVLRSQNFAQIGNPADPGNVPTAVGR